MLFYGSLSILGVPFHSHSFKVSMTTEVGLDLNYEGRTFSFLQTGCQCHLGPNNSPCFKQLAKEDIEASRLECSELTRDELDLVILSQISAHRAIASGNIRSRSFFHGTQVCITTYVESPALVIQTLLVTIKISVCALVFMAIPSVYLVMLCLLSLLLT